MYSIAYLYNIVVFVKQIPRQWSWGLSDQVQLWWESMKCLSILHVSCVCRLHLHLLHTLSQSHVLYVGEVGTFPRTETTDESSQCFLAEYITCSSAHIALTEERGESSAKVQRLLCIEFGQGVAQILYDHKRVIVCLNEPVGFVQVVLVDVLERPDGLPVQVVPPLAHVQPHSGEVRLHRAHVQHFVAVLGPRAFDVLGSGFQVLGSSHDPA